MISDVCVLIPHIATYDNRNLLEPCNRLLIPVLISMVHPPHPTPPEGLLTVCVETLRQLPPLFLPPIGLLQLPGLLDPPELFAVPE